MKWLTTLKCIITLRIYFILLGRLWSLDYIHENSMIYRWSENIKIFSDSAQGRDYCVQSIFFYNLFSFLSVQVDRIYSIDIYKFVLEISQRMWCLYILVYCNQTFSIPSFVFKISASLFSIIILCNLMPSVNNLSKSLFFFLKTLYVFVLMRSYNAIILFKLIPIFKDFNSFWCLQRNMKWK